MNIQKAADDCINTLSLSANTEKTYRNGINSFLNYLSEQNIKAADEVEAITIDHFIFFPAWLDKVYSKQTSGVYIAAAKAFFDHLIITKSLQEPTHYDMLRYKKAVEKSHKREEEKMQRFPKDDDVPKLLYAVHEYTDKSPIKERNIALLEWLASTGCRISEATALNVKDIDFVNLSAIVMGKRHKEREVFFGKTAADALKEYWRVRGSSMATDPIFFAHDKGANGRDTKRMTPTTARKVVKNIAIIAGIDHTKFTPHYFRHAFAILTLKETNNLALTQDLLGHADPKSTRVYAKIRREDLRAAHRKIFK